MRRHIPMLVVGGIVLAGTALLTTARAQSTSGVSNDGVFVARGNFDVQVLVEEAPAPRVLNRVTEVSLMRDWAVIQRNNGGKNFTLVVPRDSLVSLEMSD